MRLKRCWQVWRFSLDAILKKKSGAAIVASGEIVNFTS